MNVASDKSQVREIVLARRNAIAPAAHVTWSQACCNRLYEALHPLITSSATIAGYAATKSELNILPALELFAKDGHPLALPVMGKEEGRRQLSFHGWMPSEALLQKQYGIYEPQTPASAIIPDIVLVPLVAFDRKGTRLGYGAGYYDTALRKLRAVKSEIMAVGIAFSLQEEERLPTETWDETLNKIITEKEVIQVR